MRQRAAPEGDADTHQARRDEREHGAAAGCQEQQGRSCEDAAVQQLLALRQRRDALLWNFTVPGEAAGQVSEEVKERFPDIAWQQPQRLRNRIVHGYWPNDLTVLHTTATDQLPRFASSLRRALITLNQAPEPRHNHGLWAMHKARVTRSLIIIWDAADCASRGVNRSQQQSRPNRAERRLGAAGNHAATRAATCRSRRYVQSPSLTHQTLPEGQLNGGGCLSMIS